MDTCAFVSVCVYVSHRHTCTCCDVVIEPGPHQTNTLSLSYVSENQLDKTNVEGGCDTEKIQKRRTEGLYLMQRASEMLGLSVGSGDITVSR